MTNIYNVIRNNPEVEASIKAVLQITDKYKITLPTEKSKLTTIYENMDLDFIKSLEQNDHLRFIYCEENNLPFKNK